MQSKKMEIWVGLLILLAVLAALFLCLKVADLKSFGTQPTWTLTAKFNNVGGLKSGSPVKIGGVVIGRVTRISLDDQVLTPKVTVAIDESYLNKIPDNSSLAIRTQGLLGEQYLALNLGFSDPELGTAMLHNGDSITDTKSAMVLEDLIGQFLYSSKDKSGNADPQKPAEVEHATDAAPTH